MQQTAILLPVDNRPITYLFPQLICRLAGLKVLIPPRNLMGSLIAPTNIDALSSWLEQAVIQASGGAIFVCLDSLLYGGLIPSRRSNDSLEIILSRAAKISNLKKLCAGKFKIYAQASIMRISDNYDNTEEKPYWSQYGREIFHWSSLLHKQEAGLLDSGSELEAVEAQIKSEIRDDYLATRERNFAVNKKIIDYVVRCDIDYLIFSQDDSGKYGLNVLEKEKLIQIAKEKQATNIRAYAGADEVLMSLIAHYLNTQHRPPPKILVQYSSPSGKAIASNYEGQNIGSSFACQAEAQGLQVITEADNTDFTVIVHTGSTIQGDHICLPGFNDSSAIDTKTSAARVIDLIKQAKTPVVICDVAYANGADPLLIDLLLQHQQLFKQIWSYAGWNTTGNTIGCALAVGSACWYAMSHNILSEQDRKSLLFLRLLDDWAYQTQVRKELMATRSTDNALVASLMDKYANIIAKGLDFKPQSIQYSLPWHRTFEVEVATELS